VYRLEYLEPSTIPESKIASLEIDIRWSRHRILKHTPRLWVVVRVDIIGKMSYIIPWKSHKEMMVIQW